MMILLAMHMVIHVHLGMMLMNLQAHMVVLVVMILIRLALQHNVVHVKEMEHLAIMMIHPMTILKLVAMMLRWQRERLQMRKHIWQSNSTELIIR